MTETSVYYAVFSASIAIENGIPVAFFLDNFNRKFISNPTRLTTQTHSSILLFLLLVSTVVGQDLQENTGITTLNTTTLYPTNKTIIINRNFTSPTETQRNDIKTDIIKENNDKENKIKKVEVTSPKEERVTTWTIDANYVQPIDKHNLVVYAQVKDKENNAVRDDQKDKESKSVYAQPENKKSLTMYAQPKEKESEDSNSTDSTEQLSIERPKSNGEEKKFKPSPHLGNFFDEANLNVMKFSTSDGSLLTGKKPAVDFLGSKDFYMLNYKSPKDTYRDQLEAPYRFENTHSLTSNNWKQTLESKPTVESSVKIPAGGLYQHSNSFKENPTSESDPGDFGLDFNDEREKEKPVKKRSNPWKNLVQLMTAFLPVGLIISALTPSIITLQSTENDPYLNRLSRHMDGGFAGVPAISERCRRRLLCEIHSEENYLRSRNNPRLVRKHCYKLHCEEPQSLRRVLGWLLAHRPGVPPPPLPDLAPYNNDRDYHHRSRDYT